MSAATTPPTPENVAKVIASNLDGDYEASPHCWVRVSSNGPVVEIDATPYGEDGVMQPDAKKHFRAVVVEGDRPPIVLERPATLAQDWMGGGRPSFRSWISPDGTIRVEVDDNAEMTPADARREAARLAALAVQAEAQTGGEA